MAFHRHATATFVACFVQDPSSISMLGINMSLMLWMLQVSGPYYGQAIFCLTTPLETLSNCETSHTVNKTIQKPNFIVELSLN